MVRASSKAGFTLVEALVALTISTLLVGLVTSVFVAQSDLYDDVVRRSDAHADVRSVVDLVAGAVRGASEGSFVVAASDQMVLRVPVTVGMVCDIQGSAVSTYLPRSGAGLDTSSVSGYAFQDAAGAWSYVADAWSGLYDSSGTGVKDDCGTAGMDTTALPAAHFVALGGPGSHTYAREGAPLLLHRDLELRLETSALDPSRIGLFRGTYGATLVEVASGLGSGSAFEYRIRGDATFSASVSGSDLGNIHAVRMTAEAVAPPGGAGLDPYAYELSRVVPIRNERWE